MFWSITLKTNLIIVMKQQNSSMITLQSLKFFLNAKDLLSFQAYSLRPDFLDQILK